jgi:tetratricopeptide (TPR) repeat protein
LRWLSDLAWTYLKVGDVLLALQRTADAAVTYRKSVPLFEKLAAAQPDDLSRQRDLAFSLYETSAALTKVGRSDEALDITRKAVAIREQLVAAKPADVAWSRDLASSYDALGHLLMTEKASYEAAGYFEKEALLRKKLAAATTGAVERQRELVAAYGWMASALTAAEKPGEAAVPLRDALAVIETYAATDPDNPVWQSDLATCLVRLAQVGDEPQQRIARALTILRRLEAAGKLPEFQKAWIANLEQAAEAASK